MTTERLPVTFTLTGQPATDGTATLEHRSLGARLGRAAVMLFGLWGVAFVCVFIPIVHFFAVPAFALAGLIAAPLKLMDDVSVTEAEGVCPRCKAPRTFGGIARFRPGKAVHCSGCGSQLAVMPKSGAVPATA